METCIEDDEIAERAWDAWAARRRSAADNEISPYEIEEDEQQFNERYRAIHARLDRYIFNSWLRTAGRAIQPFHKILAPDGARLDEVGAFVFRHHGRVRQSPRPSAAPRSCSPGSHRRRSVAGGVQIRPLVTATRQMHVWRSDRRPDGRQFYAIAHAAGHRDDALNYMSSADRHLLVMRYFRAGLAATAASTAAPQGAAGVRWCWSALSAWC